VNLVIFAKKPVVALSTCFYHFAVTQCYTANGIDYEGNQSQLEPPLMHQSNFTPCMMWNQTGLSEFQDLPENFCRYAKGKTHFKHFIACVRGKAASDAKFY